MGLLSKLTNFFKGKTPEETNYLSLALTPNEVIAAIWLFNQEKVEIIGFGQKKFENIDSLVHQTAVAIDKAAQNAKSDVSKAVFGISHYWLEDGHPKGEINKILKELSEDLELDPQAFISLAAGINHLLKVEESVTAHAILVGIFKDFCEVHLLEGNKVNITKTAQSNLNFEKISQLIAQLKEEGKDLPSRIIVWGEDIQLIEKLQKGEFQDLFIHEPKVDVLTNHELVKSVAYAQAADILGHEPTLGAVSQESEPSLAKTPPVTDEFGFVEGEDILLSQKPTQKEITPKKEDYAIERQEEANLAPVAQEEYSAKAQAGGLIAKIAGIVKFRPSLKKLAIGFGFLVFIAAVANLVVGQTLTSAEVAIKVQAKNFENSFKAEVSAKAGQGSAQIAGQEIITGQTGSQKAVATGSKKLGDKAKGVVKILNWDKQPRIFGSGSEIITKDGLKFNLDGEIQVASRSATSPGENKVGATASDVGPKYNIGAGSDFTIVGFDEIFYSAVADIDFSGGDERQATIVSKDDLDRLEKSLTDSLIEKAKGSLKEKVAGQKIHDEAVGIKIVRKDFDKKLDEEATLINLDMEIEASTIAYKENHLKDFLAQNSQGEVPSNLQIRAEDIEIVELNAKRQKELLLLSGKFRAKLVPKFNEDELKDKIAGKNTKEARSIIKEIPEVSDVSVKFSPNLPLGESIPKNKSKIQLKIEAL